jgi:hypothetical protein
MSNNRSKNKNNGKKFNKIVKPLPTPGESIDGYDRNTRQSLLYVSNKEYDRNSAVNRESSSNTSEKVKSSPFSRIMSSFSSPYSASKRNSISI